MKSKNIIIFPEKGRKPSRADEKSEVSKKNITSLFQYKMGKNSASDQKSVHFDENKVWEAKKNRDEQSIQKPDLVIEKPPLLLKNAQTGQSSPFPLMLSSISTGLFLLVASVVMFNRNDSAGESRGIAHVYQRQQHIVKSIQNGSREISSIGEKPGPLEIFSVEKLQSRYRVQGENGKLMYVVLLENKEPVPMSSIDAFIREFKSLFPNYDRIRKESELLDHQYTYELVKRENQSSTFVEVTTDDQGGLLSIHVRREYSHCKST